MISCMIQLLVRATSVHIGDIASQNWQFGILYQNVQRHSIELHSCVDTACS